MIKYLFMIIISLYDNWLENIEENKSKNIEYIFPLENLETIETIKKNQNDLEMLNLNDIFEKTL